jgi:hypothetical protein
MKKNYQFKKLAKEKIYINKKIEDEIWKKKNHEGWNCKKKLKNNLKQNK